MAVRIPHVIGLGALKDYRLRLTFDDGLTGDVDLSNLLDAGPVFQPLRDPQFFAQAYVDPKTRTVAWPGGIDLDPEGLHEEAGRHPVKVDRPPRITPGVLERDHRHIHPLYGPTEDARPRCSTGRAEGNSAPA